jgi:hypothetical protein
MIKEQSEARRLFLIGTSHSRRWLTFVMLAPHRWLAG